MIRKRDLDSAIEELRDTAEGYAQDLLLVERRRCVDIFDWWTGPGQQWAPPSTVASALASDVTLEEFQAVALKEQR